MNPENSNLNLHQKTLPTLEYLLQNNNVQVDRGHVLNTLSNFANNDGFLIYKNVNEDSAQQTENQTEIQ